MTCICVVMQHDQQLRTLTTNLSTTSKRSRLSVMRTRFVICDDSSHEHNGGGSLQNGAATAVRACTHSFQLFRRGHKQHLSNTIGPALGWKLP